MATSIQDRIRTATEAEILSGTRPPGSPIDEKALAETEATLARLAARRITPESAATLKKALTTASRCAQANDRKGHAEANTVLHDLIYNDSSNPVLADHVRGVRKRLAAFRQRGFDQPGRLQTSDREHQRIVDAICKGDGEASFPKLRAAVR